ncbi:MAG: ABC transporter permease [Acidobacteriaceae bacterium]|nr:ABC transporter permease [Acidobacteriaceae bacterium]
MTIRGLRQDKGFSLVSIVLLTLGIGITSAIFTLLWQVTYAQLPVPDPSRLFTLHTTVAHMGRSDSDTQETVVSAPAFHYLANHLHSVSGVVARHGQLLNVETSTGSQHLRAELVSGNFFGVIGLKPVLGRSITEGDDNGAATVAVLSYDFWQEAFGGQISAWNSSLQLNGAPFHVIGVAPRGFNGLIAGQAPQLYLPLSALPLVNPGWNGMHDWSLRWLNIFFRLPPSSTINKAQAELKSVYQTATDEELATQRALSADYRRELAHEQVRLVPASQGIHGTLDEWRQPLRTLQYLTAAVLLLTCLNLAGLALVRSLKQQKESLVRYAMGASRGAIVRLQLIQTFILAMAGAAGGLWLARLTVLFLMHLQGLDKNGATAAEWNPYTLAFHWFAALAAALVIGFLPGWHATRLNLARSLTDVAATHSASRSHARTRRTLAALQVAFSLVLLIAAGLFAKSLSRLMSVPLGFNPNGLVVFSIDPKLSGVDANTLRLIYSNLQSALAATPGVQAATYGSGGPFPSSLDSAVLIPPPHTAILAHASGAQSIVGPNYFSTLGVPIVSGREFDARDRASTPAGVIINQTLAHKLFGNRNPVGLSVTVFNGLDPNWKATVIGVVADPRMSWKRSGMSLIYTAAQQAPRIWELSFYARSNGAVTLNEGAIRNLVRRQTPLIAPYDIGTMSIRMAEFASAERGITLLVQIFAALALTISLVGIYGVVAYSASLRKGEFGIRLALGAQRGSILLLVLREVFAILAFGLLLAVPAYTLSLTLIRPQLSNVSLHDPAVMVMSVAAVVICGISAAVTPGRRAARVDIHSVLRHN